MRHDEDEDDPLCPTCAPDPEMTPIPEDDVGWEDPDAEPEPVEDLGAGLNGRLGGANVLTGILAFDTVDRSLCQA